MTLASSLRAVAVLAACLQADVILADSIEEMRLELQFVPQETTGSSNPVLSEGLVGRPIRFILEDARPPAEKTRVGEGTDDDDQVFPWQTSTPVLPFATEVFHRTAGGWGIQIEEAADLILSAKLTRFFVTEKDQAVGSSYTAEVRLTFFLKDPNGTTLADGAASGDARRYGRKRSGENCNEVLSDAMKEAYANLLDQRTLQESWSGRRTQPPTLSGAGISPGDLLAEVLALKSEGFSDDLLVGYVRQKILSTPMTSADLITWKTAGISETVLSAVLARVQASPSQ